MENIIGTIQQLFSEAKRQERKGSRDARKASGCFNRLKKAIKQGGLLRDAQRAANADVENFQSENGSLSFTQNVSENEDGRFALNLLHATLLFETVLSFKGSQYFLGEFTGIAAWYIVLPFSLIIAYFAIMMSIRLNYFAKRASTENPGERSILVALSYVLIFIIPCANILEALEVRSQQIGSVTYSDYTMTLNLAVVLITIGLHAWLITMSEVFIRAAKSKRAREIYAVKGKVLAATDQNVEKHAVRFRSVRDEFAEAAKTFVATYYKLEELDKAAAARVLRYCDNYLIWAVNNKIYGHSMLPFHTDENGRSLLTAPLTPEQERIARLWDRFESVSGETPDSGDGNGNAVPGPEKNMSEEREGETPDPDRFIDDIDIDGSTVEPQPRPEDEVEDEREPCLTDEKYL